MVGYSKRTFCYLPKIAARFNMSKNDHPKNNLKIIAQARFSALEVVSHPSTAHARLDVIVVALSTTRRFISYLSLKSKKRSGNQSKLACQLKNKSGHDR